MSDVPDDVPATLRLFVAVNLEPAVRQSIADAVEPVRSGERGVAWTAPANLHLTLRFLGEQPAEVATAIGAALHEVARDVPPHRLVVGRFGAFPTLARARVLWCGVEANVALALLYKKVDDACAALGLGREARDFHPHVTLGRVRPRARLGPTTLREAARLLDTTWTTAVTSVDLMSSRLGPGGSRYECLAATPLTGSGR